MQLDSQTSIDWALVALFYAALHYVEAYLAPATHVKSHETRDKYFSRDRNLRTVYTEYAELKYFGYNARYDVVPFKTNDVTEHVLKDFDSIRNHLSSLM